MSTKKQIEFLLRMHAIGLQILSKYLSIKYIDLQRSIIIKVLWKLFVFFFFFVHFFTFYIFQTFDYTLKLWKNDWNSITNALTKVNIPFNKYYTTFEILSILGQIYSKRGYFSLFWVFKINFWVNSENVQSVLFLF